LILTNYSRKTSYLLPTEVAELVVQYCECETESFTLKWLICPVWWLIPIITATQEVEIGRIVIREQPGENVSETPSQSISQGQWCVPVITAAWKALHRRIIVQGQPWAKTEDLKITKAKMNWGYRSSGRVPA
jgi:hypothetical protein